MVAYGAQRMIYKICIEIMGKVLSPKLLFLSIDVDNHNTGYNKGIRDAVRMVLTKPNIFRIKKTQECWLRNNDNGVSTPIKFILK